MDTGFDSPLPPPSSSEVPIPQAHAEAVRLLNLSSIPQSFLDKVRPADGSRGKAYSGINVYTYSPLEADDNVPLQEQEVQQRCHEILHLFFTHELTDGIPFPFSDQDLRTVIENNERDLSDFVGSSEIAKKATSLTPFSFHHSIEGSAQKALTTIASDKEGLEKLINKKSHILEMNPDLIKAAIAEYAVQCVKSEMYDHYGIGDAFEEGFVMFVSSAAVYGGAKEKWQKQENSLANWYRDKISAAFSGATEAIGFIQQNGIEDFIRKVKETNPTVSTMQATNESVDVAGILKDSGRPLTEFERYMITEYIKMLEYRLFDEFPVDEIEPNYKKDCQSLVAQIDSDKRVATNNFWQTVAQHALNLSAETGNEYMMTRKENIFFLHDENEKPNETMAETLKIFGIPEINDLLKRRNHTFLKADRNEMYDRLPSGLTDIEMIEFPAEMVRLNIVPRQNLQDELAMALIRARVRLNLYFDPNMQRLALQAEFSPTFIDKNAETEKNKVSELEDQSDKLSPADFKLLISRLGYKPGDPHPLPGRDDIGVFDSAWWNKWYPKPDEGPGSPPDDKKADTKEIELGVVFQDMVSELLNLYYTNRAEFGRRSWSAPDKVMAALNRLLAKNWTQPVIIDPLLPPDRQTEPLKEIES